MGSLLRYELGSRWRAVIGWGIGLTFFGMVYISVFPQVEAEMADLADLALYAAMGIELQSFAAYVGSVVLLFIPLLLGIYAISNATATLAGEEEGGTLELLLAKPVSRVELVLAKAVALAVVLFLILAFAGAGNALVLALVKRGFETEMTGGQLFRALLAAWPVVFATAMIALFLAALLPRRRPASLAAAVIFVASYFGENISGMVPSLEPVKPFSLFAYYDSSATAITEGPQAGDAAVLLAVAVVGLALAMVSFAHRNVTTGAWSFGRNPGPERMPPAGHASPQ
ncbi:MAG: ABC transporter permease subunit [Spirochaetota bacterium]